MQCFSGRTSLFFSSLQIIPGNRWKDLQQRLRLINEHLPDQNSTAEILLQVAKEKVNT
jgi:hypothetical protein